MVAATTRSEAYRQSGFDLRFEWGLLGAVAVTSGAALVVVVDVLSFTTTLSVAIDHGLQVFPYRFRDASAAAFAADRGAVLAVGRSERRDAEVSLSPLSVRAAVQPGGVLAANPRLVLPSPNGSAICRQLSETGVTVVGACLRNAAAVGSWVRASGLGPVAVIAAGERWPGDLLRPAVEDLWGAGAVIDAVAGRVGVLSPEAGAARAAYRSVRPELETALRSCASGRELSLDGWADEVVVAAEAGSSTAVPVLDGEAFKAA